MNPQIDELARLEYREREAALIREAEIDRLLHAESASTSRPTNRLLAGLGSQMVALGTWLQQRAGTASGAAAR